MGVLNKCVVKDPPDIGGAFLGGVTRDGCVLQKAKAADIVQAKDVISVRMSK